MDDAYFMKQALQQAHKAAAEDEVPVGAVIVLNDKIIARGYNQVEKLNDPTAHAEILALRQACAVRKEPRLPDCDLYVTLEPCAMCAAAISFARLRRLYFGAYDPKGGGVEHGARFFNQPTCHHRPEVYGGVEEEKSAKLLKEFFKERRV